MGPMDPKIAKKIDKFFTQFKRKVYKKGEILVRAGDDLFGIFYLKNGHVKQYSISKKGDELVVNVFKPIAFFPMSWAINNTRNRFFYEAMTDLELWIAPKEETIEFIKTNPDILFNLISRVYSGVDGILIRMTYLMSGNAYPRLIIELVIRARRFGKKNIKEIKIKISEKDLAAESGLSRETISRGMKILKQKKFVTFEKNTLTITNIGKLEEELDQY